MINLTDAQLDKLTANAPRQRLYWEMAETGLSHSQIAEELDIDRRAVDRGIAAIIEKAQEEGFVLASPQSLKILYIDIETAPLYGWLWRMFDEVRSYKQIEREWYVISYAYKWYGDTSATHVKTLDMCSSYEAGTEDDSELIEDIRSLLDEADVVIAHNGDNFDLKKIKARMVKHRLSPPSPYRTVDTLKICRREFGFTSNRLDAVCEFLFGENKIETDIDLWKNCLMGQESAWEEMRLYNAMDVDLLEKLYLTIRHWDRSHPNMALTIDMEGQRRCTVCGSHKVVWQPGRFVYTNASKFHLYECGDCGHQMRGRSNVLTANEKYMVVHNAR